MIYRLLIWLFVFVSYEVSASYKMHFLIPDFPPYTIIKDGKPAGLGVDFVLPVLDSMSVEYTTHISYNYEEILKELIEGKSDGFFMASKNLQRDKYAIFSNSIMTNRWVWVLDKKSTLNPKNPDFKDMIKVASLLGTNTFRWLKKNGYKATAKLNAKALIESLNIKKVDAIFLAEEVFKEEVNNINDYRIVLQKKMKFGVYISKEFLSENPSFMELFNKKISERKYLGSTRLCVECLKSNHTRSEANHTSGIHE